MPKTIKRKNTTISPFMADILQIEKCIASDQEKLSKLYPKCLARVEKAIVAKAKEVRKAKGAKQKSGEKRQSKVNPVDVLIQELTALKAEQTALKTSQKKFHDQKKVLVTFEKGWDKKSKQTTKRPKKNNLAKKVNEAAKGSVNKQGENV